MLADSHLPTTFWAEAVNTACYTFNRVRVTKPQNKTPYELLFGHKPILSYIRPFGCHVTILNTLSPLGKFDGKSDEGFLVGYSVNSKAFRVYNLVTKKVEVNLHVNFLEEKPNVQGIGHRWMFDLDYLTDSMNYIPVSLQNQANPAGSKEVIDIDVQTEEAAELMVVSSTSLTEATSKAAVSEKIAKKKPHSPKQSSQTPISKSADDIMIFRKELDALALKHLGPVPATTPTSTNPVNTGSDKINTGFEGVTTGNVEAISPSANHEEEVFSDADDDEMPEIRIYDKSSEGIFEKASYDDDGIITDFNNLPDEVDVSTNHTLRIHNAHPQSQILGDPNTPVQTRSSLKKITEAHALVSYMQAQQRSNHKDQQHCLFACFLSQSEPKKVSEALEDESWKRIEKGVVVRNKARLELKVIGQKKDSLEEIDVKKHSCMSTLKEEVMSLNLLCFCDPDHPKKVYKMKSFYGSTQKSWSENLEALMKEVSNECNGSASFPFSRVNVCKSLLLETKLLAKDKGGFCACFAFQVTPKGSHLYASQEDFQVHQGKPKLACGIQEKLLSTYFLFDMQKADNSGYLSTTEAGIFAAASCYGQVLWYYLKFKGSCKGSTCDMKKDSQLSLDNWMSNWLDSGFPQTFKIEILFNIQSPEESVRRQLQLADDSGITMLQNEEIFEGLQNIGSKSGGWDQFGSNIATALICLFHRTPLLPAMLTIDMQVKGSPNAAHNSISLLPTPYTQPSLQIPTPSLTSTPPSTQSPPLTQPVQSTTPPLQPSSVQLTSSPPPIQPVQSTSSPPISTIPDTQPTHPPSPQISSPPYNETEGPSFDPSFHMSPPPSHEPEIQTSRTSEESEQLRNLLDLVPKLESRVESLEKELSDTKQTLGTAVLKLIKKIKKLENKLRQKRKREETEYEEDAAGQDQDIPSQTDQGNTFVTPEKSKVSGEAQEEQISPSTLEAAQILTNVASEGFQGSQAPPGSKIYRRKPKSTTTPTKVLDFEEPATRPVNTASTEVNTGSTPSAQVNTDY
ncbi:ribonuclease H-like domain-containing protein [Tanacetum coccineum]